MNKLASQPASPQLFVSSKDFFVENLHKCAERRKVKIVPQVIQYMANLLEHFMISHNFYEADISEVGTKNPRTLAEILLSAQTAEAQAKFVLLKKLGDRTLYISGFFADSLNRSLVDLDYYKNMGITAYLSLSDLVQEDTSAKVFQELANKFTDLTDLLTLMSQEAMVQNDQSILRLYERYLKTGSELAKERLTDLGVIPISEQDAKKVSGQ